LCAVEPLFFQVPLTPTELENLGPGVPVIEDGFEGVVSPLDLFGDNLPDDVRAAVDPNCALLGQCGEDRCSSRWRAIRYTYSRGTGIELKLRIVYCWKKGHDDIYYTNANATWWMDRVAENRKDLYPQGYRSDSGIKCDAQSGKCYAKWGFDWVIKTCLDHFCRITYDQEPWISCIGFAGGTGDCSSKPE